MTSSNVASPAVDPIRPGDVIVVPAGADLGGRHAPYRFHIVTVGRYDAHFDRIFLTGYDVNLSGLHRGAATGTTTERTAYVERGRLTAATVAIDVAGEVWTVPLTVAAGSFAAHPLLPVLSCEDCAERFGGEMYPNAEAYATGHTHRHEGCGHVVQCIHADLGEPCQAYEWFGYRCWRCEDGIPD